MEFGDNHLSYVDYGFIAGTFSLSLAIGLYYAFAKQTTDDLLVGGRKMSALPVAFSMLVTHLSAISILGLPAEIFYHGLQIVMMAIMGTIAFPIGAFLVVPVLYKMKLTSVYKYLELRYDSVLTSWLASSLFLIQVTMLSGVVIYAPSIPLEHMMGVPPWISIVSIAACGTLYTAVGGLKAVIWTDVIQLIGILVGMFAIVVKGVISAGGFSRIFEVAGENGRLDIFDLTIDPFMRHNTFNFVLGIGLTLIFVNTTHQSQVQRYSSLPNLKSAIRAILFSIPIGLIIMALIVFTGLSIFVVYSDCDPRRSGKIKVQDAIVPYFVTQQLNDIPGFLGLFISCIFSAVLSTISSSVNSLVAVTWQDFCMKISCFQTMRETNKAHVTRALGFVYGGVIIGCAFLASNLASLLPMTMTGIGATSGPILAVFIMGLFMPCINKYGSSAGMVAGVLGMIAYVVQSFRIGYNQHIPLPTSVEGCSPGQQFSPSPLFNQTEVEWPQKFFTISYLWYTTMGAVMTFVVALLVSVITGGCSKSQRSEINSDYLHPLIRKSGCAPSNQKRVHRTAHSTGSISRTEVGGFDRISRESSPPHPSTARARSTSPPNVSVHPYPYLYQPVPSTSGSRPPLNIRQVQETLL